MASKNKEVVMGPWLLLGLDSLIAGIAVGPMMGRRLSVLVPFALLFGIVYAIPALRRRMWVANAVAGIS
jgi:hypothetical protein